MIRNESSVRNGVGGRIVGHCDRLRADTPICPYGMDVWGAATIRDLNSHIT